MTLKLNAWQRMILLTMVSNVKGDLRTIRKALRAIDMLELSAKEREVVGLTEHPNGAVTWMDATYRFELDIDEDMVAFLRQQVEARTDWPVSTDVVDLCEQLGVREADA
jgi:hypothetical protein